MGFFPFAHHFFSTYYFFLLVLRALDLLVLCVILLGIWKLIDWIDNLRRHFQKTLIPVSWLDAPTVIFFLPFNKREFATFSCFFWRQWILSQILHAWILLNRSWLKNRLASCSEVRPQLNWSLHQPCIRVNRTCSREETRGRNINSHWLSGSWAPKPRY